MGNDNAKEEQASPPRQDGLRIEHERFERYRYLPEEDQMEVTMDVPEEREVRQWEAELAKIAGFEHRSCLLLPATYEYTPKGWCGNIGSLKARYEYFPFLFQDELDNRITNHSRFDEEELWYLLYCLVGCARDFAATERRIGDVRPHNIFINEEGQVKVACLLSWPNEKDAFDKAAYEKIATFLAPEEVALLTRGNLENKTNQVLAESFAIGLTLLSAGLLFNANQLYSSDCRVMDIGKLRTKVREWMQLQEGNYSPLLKNIVAALCTVQHEEREISLDVEDLLRPFQDEILNLRPFNHAAVDFQFPIQGKSRSPQHPSAPQTQHPGLRVLPEQRQVVYAHQPISQQPIPRIIVPPAEGNREVRYATVQAPTNQQPQTFSQLPKPAQIVHLPPQTMPKPHSPPQANQFFIKSPNLQPSEHQPPFKIYQSQYAVSNAPQPPLPPTQTYSGPGDFLRKIDAQLQTSRRMYPS